MFSRQFGWLASLALALAVAGCAGGEQSTTAEAPSEPAPAAKPDVVSAATGELSNFSAANLKQAKKLFQAECGRCHVGGQTYGTYNSTDVNLSYDALTNSTPPRNNVANLVDYMKKPTSYDGRTDLLKTGEHASYTALGDEKLRLIAAHILKEATSNPNWGQGKDTR
ncbi:MAG: cytochrome c-550 [Aphanocapsa lilacina HA4352-LM1]|jgi:photosystem II cytochrome c550|nr:cytochrome c-550 [Aphanocapsa lilacina HA4352-LM1]